MRKATRERRSRGRGTPRNFGEVDDALAVPLLEAPHDVVVLFGDGALGPLPQRPLGDTVSPVWTLWRT